MDYRAFSMPYIKNGQQFYRSYCLIEPGAWDLGVSTKRILEILAEMGFKVLKPNLLTFLRGLVGNTEYLRGAEIWQAPRIVDCSTLVVWAYSWLGVQMPRYAIEQAKLGKPSDLPDLRLGDLVFTKGLIPRTDKAIPNGIGHVGIATGQGTVIHAKDVKKGVVEEPIAKISSDLSTFRGVSRILPPRGWWTVIAPWGVPINYSSDLRWKVGSKLKRRE